MMQDKILPTDVSIITTYRCQMRCKMCNIWQYPTDIKKEIKAKDLELLPRLKFANISGGEPFQRMDLEDIIEVAFEKANRVVISTSGWHTERVIRLAERFPKVGIRVSIEGLAQKNDELRGREGSYDRGLRLLLALSEMGLKDIGFGITVSNSNSDDMLRLYELSKRFKLEFATAAFHNSYYFHKYDNAINNKEEMIENFKILITSLLRQNSVKSWYRAFFNLGLINYINGDRRMLPCEAGHENFFIDPYGDVYPCNGMEEHIWKETMGNIRQYSKFEDLWFSDQAIKVRNLVKQCPKNCWMVGTAAPVMKKYLRYPTAWVLKNKLKSMFGQEIDVENMPYYDVGQNPLQGDLNYARMAPFAKQDTVKPNAAIPLIDD